MPEITKDLERKIVAMGDFFAIDPRGIKKRLDEMKKNKRKIKGVWISSRGWMWIAQEQPTKMTWFGVTFSPYVPEGEYGSWYLDDPETIGARVVVQPEYRWKVSQEEIKRHRKMINKLL